MTFKFFCRRLLFLLKSMQISCSRQYKMMPDNFKRNLHYINKKKVEHVIFIPNWKRIKSLFFVKYTVILIWSFKWSCILGLSYEISTNPQKSHMKILRGWWINFLSFYCFFFFFWRNIYPLKTIMWKDLLVRPPPAD